MLDDNNKAHTCEAHNYIMEILHDMKEKDLRRDEREEARSKENQDLKENLVKLTENLFELQRNYKRTESTVSTNGFKIETNNSFVNKAIGVVGTISIIAAFAPLVLWGIQRLVEVK